MKTILKTILFIFLSLFLTSCILTLPAASTESEKKTPESMQAPPKRPTQDVKRPAEPAVRPTQDVKRPTEPVRRPTETNNTGRVDAPKGKKIKENSTPPSNYSRINRQK